MTGLRMRSGVVLPAILFGAATALGGTGAVSEIALYKPFAQYILWIGSVGRRIA
jgi:hypothetical protein